MRLLGYFIAFLLIFVSQGYAAPKGCDKIKSYIKDNLQTTGTLEQADNGSLYVNVSDDYIKKLIPFIKSQGYVPPPFFGGQNNHGAHITVIHPVEVENYKIGQIDEVGNTVSFKVKDCEVVKTNRAGVDSVYMIVVDSPDLDKLRKKYGLPKNKHEYHITVGVKRTPAPAATPAPEPAPAS